MLTEKELAEIRQRLEKTTPGSWEIKRKKLEGEAAKSASLDGLDSDRVIDQIGPIEWSTYVEDSYVYSETWLHLSDEDAEFISHARDDIKRLLDHIENFKG